MQHFIFINRRKNTNRRTINPVGFAFQHNTHPMRLRGKERRDINRDLADDYYAFIQKNQTGLQP